MPRSNTYHFNTAETFWSRVDIKGPDECWLWTGPTKASHGYGQMQMRAVFHVKNPIRAHRIAWSLTKGEGKLPEGGIRTHIHHTCGVKACMNPAHLELMSSSDHKKLHHHSAQCPNCGHFLNQS